MKKFYQIVLVTCLMLFAFGLTANSQQAQNKTMVEEFVSDVRITIAANKLIVENVPKDGMFEVFSIVGVKVYGEKIKAGTNEYTLNLPKGYYIVKIGDIVKKIAVR